MNSRGMARGIGVLAVGAALLGAGARGVLADESDSDAHEVPVAAGTLDDGSDLLPLAQIGIGEAVAAAQNAASGAVGEVDLEYLGDTLVYTVDIGRHDVKVDATTGKVLAVDADD